MVVHKSSDLWTVIPTGRMWLQYSLKCSLKSEGFMDRKMWITPTNPQLLTVATMSRIHPEVNAEDVPTRLKNVNVIDRLNGNDKT